MSRPKVQMLAALAGLMSVTRFGSQGRGGVGGFAMKAEDRAKRRSERHGSPDTQALRIAKADAKRNRKADARRPSPSMSQTNE